MMTLQEYNKDFTEFRDRIKKVAGSRNHKVKNSLGIRQAFLFLQKNKWFDVGTPLKESQFQKIVRKVNEGLADWLSSGNEVRLSNGMGTLELRKYQNCVSTKNGKLKISYPIDWDATLKLWYEDEESYKNKQLVRYTQKEVIRVLYNRSNAIYENKVFFQFIVNRNVKRTIMKKLKKGQIDAFKYE